MKERCDLPPRSGVFAGSPSVRWLTTFCAIVYFLLPPFSYCTCKDLCIAAETQTCAPQSSGRVAAPLRSFVGGRSCEESKSLRARPCCNCRRCQDGRCQDGRCQDGRFAPNGPGAKKTCCVKFFKSGATFSSDVSKEVKNKDPRRAIAVDLCGSFERRASKVSLVAASFVSPPRSRHKLHLLFCVWRD